MVVDLLCFWIGLSNLLCWSNDVSFWLVELERKDTTSTKNGIKRSDTLLVECTISFGYRYRYRYDSDRSQCKMNSYNSVFLALFGCVPSLICGVVVTLNARESTDDEENSNLKIQVF